MTHSAPAPDDPTRISTFAIPGMDCPSEERLVRMALDDLPGVDHLDFDLDARRLRVWHAGPSDAVLARLAPLGFGAKLAGTEVTHEAPPVAVTDRAAEARVLKQVLAINAVMFVVELILGLVAQSTGLLADSLDMLADATVYGLALSAVGGAVARQRGAARLSGLLQLALAVGVLAEVGRRAVVGSEPLGGLMIAVAAVALVANLACVALLARHRHGGVHLKASWIFTASDALANLGVILAGVGVALTGAAWPDLVVGTAVGLVVLASAIRILRL